MEYTDLHSHIAWDVDDGSSCIEESQAMLKAAREDGITRIVSTPHVIPGHTRAADLADIKARQKELIELAAKEGIEIITAGEVRLNDLFLKDLNSGILPLIHQGPYMLAEFDVMEDYSQQKEYGDLLYEMTVRKIRPVIAHVERYFHGKPDYQVLDEWKEAGYVFQINATSLLGLDTPQSRKNAMELIRKGYAHIVSTDAHHARGRRVENLSEAAQAVEKEFGPQTAEILFLSNPNQIIEGKDIENIEVHKKWKWKLFTK